MVGRGGFDWRRFTEPGPRGRCPFLVCEIMKTTGEQCLLGITSSAVAGQCTQCLVLNEQCKCAMQLLALRGAGQAAPSAASPGAAWLRPPAVSARCGIRPRDAGNSNVDNLINHEARLCLASKLYGTCGCC
jgi:hypothetical protein